MKKILTQILFFALSLSYMLSVQANTAREEYIAEPQKDRVSRYSSTKNVYVLTDDDVGNHVLTVRVKESKNRDAGGEDGGEDGFVIHDVKTIDLTVNPQTTCPAPIFEQVSVGSEAVLYDFENSDNTNVLSASTVQGSFESIGSVFDDGGNLDGVLYKSIAYKLTIPNDNTEIKFTNGVGVSPEDDTRVSVYSIFNNQLQYETSFGRYDIQNDFSSYTFNTGDYVILFNENAEGNTPTGIFSSGCNYNNGACEIIQPPDVNIGMTVTSPSGMFILNKYDFASQYIKQPTRLEFRASAPSGIASYQLNINNQIVDLTTTDNTYFYLDEENSAHKNLFDSVIYGSGNVQLNATAIITSTCGAVTNHDFIIDVALPPPVSVEFSDTALNPLIMLHGQQKTINIDVTDVARNLDTVKAVLFPVGSTVSNESIQQQIQDVDNIIGEYSFIDVAYEVYDSCYEGCFGIRANYDVDGLSVPENYKFALPISLTYPEHLIGHYELRIVSEDRQGRVAYTDSIPLEIAESFLPPNAEITLPPYNPPPGQVASIDVAIDSLSGIDRIEWQVSNAINTSVQTINFSGEKEITQTINLQVSSATIVGDSLDILVTVFSAEGNSSTTSAQLIVGAWGERDVVYDDDFRNPTPIDDMRYANVTFPNGTYFTIPADAGLLFNSLNIQDGARIFISEPLVLNESLNIDSGGELSALTVLSENQGGGFNYGGSHGGDAYEHQGDPANETNRIDHIAYGNLKYPRFPGASGGSLTGTAYVRGGGVIEITADSIINNGGIYANGQDRSRYFNPGTGGGAGGSILITTTSLSGTGSIHANGGAVPTYSNDRTSITGSGGRIAIHYDSYIGASDSPYEEMDIQVYNGYRGTSFNIGLGGSGTIFLKHSNQEFGSLFVDNYPGNTVIGAKTTIPSAGRHTISDVISLGSNQYEIFTIGSPWQSPDSDKWINGLIDVDVSLDANNPDATLYTIVTNTENSFTVNSDISLLGLIGNELIDVLKLDSLTVKNGTRMALAGRVDTTEFDIERNSLDYVNEIESRQVYDLGDYIQHSGTQFFIGDVSANSFAIAEDPGILLNLPATVQSQHYEYQEGSTTSCPDGQFGAINQACSVVWYEFEFTEETTFIADIHADTTLTNSSDRIEVYLLKADYSNSIIDSTSVKYYAGQSSFGLFEVVPAGKYVVAVYPDPFHDNEVRSELDIIRSGIVDYTDSQTGVARDFRYQIDFLGNDLSIQPQRITGADATERFSLVENNCTQNHLEPAFSPCSTTFQDITLTQSGVYKFDLTPLGPDDDVFLSLYKIIDGAVDRSSIFSMSSTYLNSTSSRTTELDSGEYRLIVKGREDFRFLANYQGLDYALEIYYGDYPLNNEPIIANIIGDLNVTDAVSLSESGEVYIRDNLSANSIDLIGRSDLIVGDSLSTLGNISLGEVSTLNADTIVTNELGLDRVSTVTANEILASSHVIVDDSSNLFANTLQVNNSANLLVNNQGEIWLDDLLNVSGILSAGTSTDLRARNIIADSIQLDGSAGLIELASENINSNSATLLSTRVLPFRPRLSSQIDYPGIDMEVVNLFSFNSATTFDFSQIASAELFPGLYPLCDTGELPNGGHAGQGSGGTNSICVYDRYDVSIAPGSAGGTRLGGGIVNLSANTLEANGSVSASGNYWGSSGGTINLSASVLTGSGNLSASGTGRTTYGSGGRIVVNVDDYSAFTGTLKANSNSTLAGAGTVYYTGQLLDIAHLVIDNNNQVAPVGSTPIRTVGNQLIDSISQVTPGVWEISVPTAQWISSSASNETGLTDRLVSLDANDLNAPLYRINSNTETTLIIETPVDLSIYSNTNLIGVHEFETLIIRNGAYADFGSDRVIVNDLVNSEIDLARITYGQGSIVQ